MHTYRRHTLLAALPASVITFVTEVCRTASNMDARSGGSLSVAVLATGLVAAHLMTVDVGLQGAAGGAGSQLDCTGACACSLLERRQMWPCLLQAATGALAMAALATMSSLGCWFYITPALRWYSSATPPFLLLPHARLLLFCQFRLSTASYMFAREWHVCSNIMVA
jgi:hypothetical protein